MQTLSLVPHLEIAHFMNFMFYFSLSLWNKEGRVHGLDSKGQIVESQEHGLRTFSQLRSWKHKFSLEVHVTGACEEVGVIGGGRVGRG